MKEHISDSNKITRNYFDSLLLEQRLIDAVYPDTGFSVFGEKFSTPVMTAALSHLGTFNPDVEKPMEAYALGARKVNTLHWLGMADEDTFDAVMACGVKTVRIVKPYADEELIKMQLMRAEAAGCLAVGMDIDHSFSRLGEDDVVLGERMEPKTSDRLRSYIEMTGLPFVIKGVLSVRDAVACKALGASGIVVSHHGGRMNYAIPPLMILREIREALGPDFPVFVDCGIISGMDAYKALALGATAVSVGKHLIPYIRKGGADAVAKRIDEMTAELRGVMAYTGVGDMNSFDPAVIHLRTFGGNET